MIGTLALIGPEEGMIVLVAILVLFGGKKIPELMRGVGQGIGELKKGLEEGKTALMTEPRPTTDSATRLDQQHLTERKEAVASIQPAAPVEPTSSDEKPGV